MLGVPLFLSARNPTGPSVNFRWTSGVLSWLMSEMLGSKYCPGAGFVLRMAARTSSSLDSVR